MAQAYAAAMEHAEWQAKKVIRKYFQRRPLGHIEAEHHRYMSAQPVLSCRTVDIDACGTRTYQAKTADEILNDQHRLIHEIYTQARNVFSAPQESSQQSSPGRKNKAYGQALRSLQIEGQGANRPKTAAASSSNEKFSQLQARGSAKGKKANRSKSAVAAYIQSDLETDPENSQKQLKMNSMIRQSWKPENRALTEGKYVRGKQDGPSVPTNLKTSSSNSWMSFGGGQSDHSAGLIDAFTGVRASGNFSIDGSTGIAVTKHLHKGDKIHVGRNGSPLHYMMDEDYFDEDLHAKHYFQDETYFTMDDLVKSGNVKLIKPSLQSRPIAETKPALPRDLKTAPVVFYRLEEVQRPVSNTASQQGMAREPVQDRAYAVQQRKSARKNIDGTRHRPSSRMTHWSVEKTKQSEPAADLLIQSTKLGPNLYQELQKSVETFSDNPIEITAKAQVLRINTGFNDSFAENTQVEKADEPVEDKNVAEQRTDELYNQYKNLENSGGKDLARKRRTPSPKAVAEFMRRENKRPGTSAARVSLDGSLVGDSSSGTTGSRQRARSAGLPLRQVSAAASGYKNNSRPPPLKPSLHKSSAAVGSSIKKLNVQNGKAQDTEYLQIHQQMTINYDAKNGLNARIGVTSRQRNEQAVDSVSNCNKPGSETSPLDLSLEQNAAGSVASEHSSQANSARLSTLDTGRGTPENFESEDVKYAFDIPTGETDNEVTLVYTKK